MFAVRRHTDIQGVESVFDDYRKNWLRRQHSGIRLGDAGNSPDDTPICGDSSLGGYAPDRVTSCGSGHVTRAFSTGLHARDRKDGADIRETGGMSYLGYEHLVSNNFFLGFGASGLGSAINNRAGEGMKADVAEVAGHLLGGYRINDNNMLAWNLTFVRSAHDVTRGGNITSKFDTNSVFLNGVWFTNVALTKTAYVSFGLDYTLQFTLGEDIIESNGIKQGRFPPVREQWQGDFTGSALFVQPLDKAELFARIGVTVSVLNVPSRSVDMPIDVGAAIRITDNLAFVGSVGSTYLFSNYTEARGTARVIGRF